MLLPAPPTCFLYGLALRIRSTARCRKPRPPTFLAELVEGTGFPRPSVSTGAITPPAVSSGPMRPVPWSKKSVGIGWCFIVTAVGYLIALGFLFAHSSAVPCAAWPVRMARCRAPVSIRLGVPELRIALTLTAVVTDIRFQPPGTHSVAGRTDLRRRRRRHAALHRHRRSDPSSGPGVCRDDIAVPRRRRHRVRGGEYDDRALTESGAGGGCLRAHRAD